MATFRYNILLILFIFTISCSENKISEQVIEIIDSNQVNSNENNSINQTKNDTTSLVKIQVPVDELVPAEFSEDEIQTLIETGKADFVVNLRNGLNDYYKGNLDSPYFEPSAIRAVDDNLSTYNKNYYKSKFYILTVNSDYPAGGIFLDILFKNMPDKVFTVWMFETDNIYKIRMFQQNIDYKTSDIKATLKLFENVFKREDTAV